MCKAVKYAEKLMITYDEIQTNMKELADKMSELDLKEQDIMHFMENEKFSASRGYELAKALKEVRVERRSIKNEFQILQSLVATFVMPTKDKLKSSYDRVVELDEEKKTKTTYTPRVIKNI